MVAAVLNRHEGAGARGSQRRGIASHIPRPRVELGCIGDQPVNLVHRADFRMLELVVEHLAAHPQARVSLNVSPDTMEVLSTALSAAVRNVLLYRSLLESIDELSEARREAAPLRLS